MAGLFDDLPEANQNSDDGLFDDIPAAKAAATKSPAFLERLLSDGAPFADPMGTGAAEIMQVAAPRRTSVLDGVQFPPQPEGIDFRAANDRAMRPPAPRARGISEARPSTPVDSGFVENAARILRKTVGGIEQGKSGLLRMAGDVTGLDSVSEFARDWNRSATELSNRTQAGKTTIDGFTPGSIVQDLPGAAEGAAVSIAQQLPALATGNVPAALAIMMGQSTGQQFNEVRDKGLDLAPAIVNAVLTGGAEVVGEKFGGTPGTIKALKGALAGNAPARVAADMARAGLKDLPGELGTTLMQYGTDAAPVIGTNADASLAELGGQLKSTALQTILQGGMMSGGGAALAKAAQSAGARPDPAQPDATVPSESNPAMPAAAAPAPQARKAGAIDRWVAGRQAASEIDRAAQEIADKPTPAIAQQTVAGIFADLPDAPAAAPAARVVETAPARAPVAAEFDVNQPATLDAQAPAAIETIAPQKATDALEPLAPSVIERLMGEGWTPPAAQSKETLALSQPAPTATKTIATGNQNVQDPTPQLGPEAQATPAPAAEMGADTFADIQAPASAGAAPAQAAGLKGSETQYQQAQPAIESVAPQRLGRDNVAMAEGGKPFKSRLQASTARKGQTMMRVIKVDGGYALADKTPAQLAAQEKTSRRLGFAHTTARGQPAAAHEFIADAGGLVPAERADMNMQGNIRIGNRTLFAGAGKGLTIERATERLVEEGYLPEDAGHDEARSLIKRSMTAPQYTPEGTERMAEAEAQARFDEAAVRDDAVAEVEALDDNEAIPEDAIPWDEPYNTSTEDAMRALGFTEQEISDAITDEPGSPQADSQGSGRPDESAAGQEAADSGRGEATPQPVQDSAPDEGLTGYTPKEVTDRLDKLEQAEKDRQAADNKADADAKKERERKDIASRQNASAENFELGQDADDSLSGQGSMFSRPANAAAPSAFRPIKTKRGATGFLNADIALGSPRLNVRQPGGDVTRIDFDIRDTAAFTRAQTDGMANAEAREAAHVGILTMDMDKAGQFKSLRNIEIFQSKRGNSSAEKVVGSIMASLPPGAKLHIHDILPTATGFWDKMGAKFPRSEDFMEAYLTPEQYKAAYDTRPRTAGASGQSQESRAATDGAGRGGRSGADGQDVSSSQLAKNSDRVSTPDQVRAVLAARFGPLAARMEARGFLKIWPTTIAFNEAAQGSEKIDGIAQGMWDGKTAHLFADGIQQGDEIGVFLHEAGEHASMQKMLGPDKYKSLVARAHALAFADDPVALEAVSRIPDDTPEKFRDSELLAYMIETVASKGAKATPTARKWLADVVAAIRAWWFQTGLNQALSKYGKGLELTPKDIAALAMRAVRWQGQQQGGAAGVRMSVRGTNEAVTNPKDVVGNTQGGRSADDTSPGASVDESTGLPLNADGTVTLYHHTSAANAKAIRASGKLKADAEPDVYVTTHRETDTGYGDTAVPIRVRPDQLSIDDEFPNGRKDFRLNVGKPGGSIKVAVENESTAPDGDGASFAGGTKASQGTTTGRYSRPAPAASSWTAPPGAPPVNPKTGSPLAPQPWNVAEPGTMDNFVRAIQDNKIDLKRVREAIAAQAGPLTTQTDAYLSEELYHGKVSARVTALHEQQVEPILKKIAVAGQNVGITLDDVNQYLHARHAPERNAAMQAINPGMPNNAALSGMSDTEAATIMADFAAAGKTPGLANIVADVDQLLSDTRTGLVADGLEDAGTVQAWGQAYQHYAPLQRDIKSSGTPKGQGISIRGPEAKRAVGSNKEVVNILANIVAQAETAAIRAEKAIVGRALLDMARKYPNPDFWRVDIAPTKPRIDKETGLVIRNAVDPMFQTADNVVMVKDYGIEHFIVFEKNSERAMAVAKAMKNIDIAPMNKILEVASKGTRFIASLLTQRNPLFWMTNFSRDIQGAMINLQGTDAEGLQGKVLANLPKAFKGMHSLVRGTGTGQWARYAREVQEAGGTTGYMQQFENSDARMDDLKKIVAQMQQGKADPRRLARVALDFVDDYNDIIENAVRLSVFQAARDNGVSTDKAASIAKNITVNFNRKGNLTPPINALYMFFNASVQGTARLTQAVATSRSAQVIVGGIAVMGFLLDAMNRAMAGDDDETGRNRYDMISEFEKSKNWIFMNPMRPGEYVKVPLPLGPHVFHNAGRLLSDATFRKNKRNAAEYGWGMASTLLDAFSPLGATPSVGQLIAPSVLDPVLQLAENKSFTGGPVYRSDDMGFGKTDPKPAYTRHFESTPDLWKAASRGLNDISGGDKDKPGHLNVEPDILKHVFYAMTGGPGRMLDQITDTGQAQARGDSPSVNRVPFVSRFYGENDDRQRERVYYDDRKHAMDTKTRFDHFSKIGRPDLAREVAEELGDGDFIKGRRMMREHANAQSSVRKINKQIRSELQKQGAGEDRAEQLRALKQRRVKVMGSTGRDTEDE